MVLLDDDDLPAADERGVLAASKDPAMPTAPAGEQEDTNASPEPEVIQEDNEFSESDSDEMMEADDEDEEEYEGLERHIFKTSNRLVDDIVADLLFLRDPQASEGLSGGILKVPCLKYAKELSSFSYNPYDLYILNPAGTIFNAPSEHYDSLINSKDKVSVIRGILFSNSESTFSKSKVYHVRLAIKTKTDDEKSVSKNEFHLCDLSDDDKVDLTRATTVRDDDHDDLKTCAPKLLDSASYVCSLTHKVVHIEISEPEFDHNDLHDYEIGPIQVRYIKARQIHPDLPEQIPSPATCLNTLYRVMKGALVATGDGDVKTINASHKSLVSHTNSAILTRKLHFKLQDGEFYPPPMFNADDRSHCLMRESFIRMKLEVMFLGTKAYSAGAPSPFSNISFSTRKDIIFIELADHASRLHHAFAKDECFIALSSYPFYSDDLIINCFHKMVTSDPNNTPRYYDAICDISNRQGNFKLSQFVAKLKSSNMFGEREINRAFQTLGIDPTQADLITDDLLISMYKTESAQHPMDDYLRNALKIIGSYKKSGNIERFLKYEPLELSESYSLLGVDPEVDDDIIQTAFLMKKLDDPREEGALVRALISIATNRESFLLLNQVESEYPDCVEEMSFKEACHNLGMEETASEMQAIEIFQMGGRKSMRARKALRVVGEAKNSKLIDSFLRTGLIDHSALPARQWPVGLNNIGNTCYLNSLLQYYYSIKPLREAVINFNDVYTGQDIYRNRRIGGGLVGDDEVERSFQFTYYLRNLFYEQMHTKERRISPPPELPYLAFLRSSVKVAFESDEKKSEGVEQMIKSSSTDDDHTKNYGNNSSDLIELDQFEDNIGDISHEVGAQDNSNHATKPKAAMISEDEMNIAFELGRQQDVTECGSNILSQIEAAFKPEGFDPDDSNDQIDLVKRLFFGKTIEHLVGGGEGERSSVVRFHSLNINITNVPRSLPDALVDLFFESETMDSGLVRSEKILKAPKILQIQVQRVLFDRVTQNSYKDAYQFPFPERLYLDPYLETDDPTIFQKRDDVLRWKAEVRELKARRELLLKKNDHGFSYKDSLKTTRNWLEDRALADEETIRVLDKQIAKFDEDLMDIFNKVNQLESKIDHHFDKYQRHGYSVFAIFIHRGTANYGHYWVYIRDIKRNIYRKYNDDEVTEVPASEVLNFDEGNTATPYFVVYIRDGDEDCIDPLCRELVEENS